MFGRVEMGWMLERYRGGHGNLLSGPGTGIGSSGMTAGIGVWSVVKM